MKKLFYIPLACSMLLFGACSDKDSSVDTPTGIVLELSAVNKLDNGFGRAPLYSQEAVQSVEVVNVYVFQKQPDPSTDYLYIKTIPITPWLKGSTFQRHEIAQIDDFLQGSYKFLAVGTDKADVNPYTITTMGPTTKFDDVTASLAAFNNAELEIFAGSKAVTVTGTGMRVPIQMTRQVAGLLAYFKNVPTNIENVDVKYLRLTMSSANKTVNLTTGVGSVPKTSPATYDLFNVDLSAQGSTDEVYNGNDLTAQGVVKVDKSQLNGAFLVPINGVTLTLGLYGTDGTTPVKTWTVLDNTSTSINILPNNFYALGTKMQAGNTNGGGGEGSTPDAPIDLLTDQSITVTILPNWSAIHNLVIQ